MTVFIPFPSFFSYKSVLTCTLVGGERGPIPLYLLPLDRPTETVRASR